VKPSKYDALDGLDALLGGKPEKKRGPAPGPKKDKPSRALPPYEEPEERFPGNKSPGTQKQIVRSPRVIPETYQAKKYNKTKNNAAAGIIFGPGALGEKKKTQQRRETVINWLLDGHSYEGENMSVTELATALNVPIETIETDLNRIKTQMALYYEDQHNKEMPILAYMLMEMKMQDRGRALAIHNQIMSDIDSETTENKIVEINGTGFKRAGMSGRDKAAMYSAAINALDLAHKATNGLDNIFKLVGGPERVRAILQARAIQQGAGDGKQIGSMSDVQGMLMTLPEFQSVLPSQRKAGGLKTPGFLTMTAEDKEVMDIGEREYAKKATKERAARILEEE
jgi:hypothetical protein